MSELGARLREARENQNISLQEAEQATRIRRVFLEAIEEERFEDLPGEVYGRGFIRSYAQFLGLDANELLQGSSVQVAKHEPVHVPRVLDEPLNPLSHNPGRWMLLLALIVIGVGVWYLYNTVYLDNGFTVQSWWPPVIETSVQHTEEWESVPHAPAVPALTPDRAPGGVSIGQSSGPEAIAQPTATPTVLPTATPSPTPTAVPTATLTPIVGVLVEALATADTYIEANVDGERVMTGILSISETATWQAEEIITLRIGNAGGLQLLVNGVDVGSLGASGQVINIEYTIDDLPTD